MRVRVTFAVIALLAGFVSLWGQQAQPPPPVPAIRRSVDLVNVLFTVVNQRNKIVADLGQENFLVFDDNIPQEIRFFSRQGDLPLRVGLLLDTSNSIRRRFQFEQEAAVDFLYSLIRKDKDQAFLMDVDDDPEIVQDFTSDLDRLRDAIQQQRAGGGTALYDAVYQASQHLASQVPQQGDAPMEARSVLVVISDGDDNVSRHSRGEALEMAQRAGVVIYTISTSTDWIITDKETNDGNSADRKYFKTEGDRLLEQIATESGGQAFFPYHVDDLAKSFGNIGDGLRSQYSLAFVPSSRSTTDGKFHIIRVEVSTKGLRVQARKGYYADQPQAPEADTPGK
jgi:Ca-activated chloride channel homolog